MEGGAAGRSSVNGAGVTRPRLGGMTVSSRISSEKVSPSYLTISFSIFREVRAARGSRAVLAMVLELPDAYGRIF